MHFRFLIAAVALAGCSTMALSARRRRLPPPRRSCNGNWTPSCFDLLHAGKPHTQGLEAMRKTYGELFVNAPGLRCEIARRIVEGPYVIDHEICDLGEAGAPAMRAAAIYQVEDGLIRRVWFAFEE